MQIFYLKHIDSTQKYLKNIIKNKDVEAPYAVVSDIQTDGIGSRNSRWQSMEGNLFLSFAIKIEDLPKDLKLESASIYFSYILKEILFEHGSKIWLKWPNDFYVKDKKIGGMITNIIEDSLICGIGLNLVTSPQNFAKLDIEVNRDDLLNKYFKNIKSLFSWKQIFSKYELEFGKNKNFFTHSMNSKISLEDAKLHYDGSLIVDNKRIYSLR